MIYNRIKSVFVIPFFGSLIGLELDITSTPNTTGLAKMFIWVLLKMLWKNPNKHFGQPTVWNIREICRRLLGKMFSLTEEIALGEKTLSPHYPLPTGLLYGESHGQRSLAGYSPKGHKESDTMEILSTKIYIDICAHSLRLPWPKPHGQAKIQLIKLLISIDRLVMVQKKVFTWKL